VCACACVCVCVCVCVRAIIMYTDPAFYFVDGLPLP